MRRLKIWGVVLCIVLVRFSTASSHYSGDEDEIMETSGHDEAFRDGQLASVLSGLLRRRPASVMRAVTNINSHEGHDHVVGESPDRILCLFQDNDSKSRKPKGSKGKHSAPGGHQKGQQQQYGPPAQQQYGPPQAQAQQYGPPQAQAQQYGPPAQPQQYGPPAPQVQQYGPPAQQQQYMPPPPQAQQYGPPAQPQQYGPPAPQVQQYGPPAQQEQYGPPAQQAQVQQYGPPPQPQQYGPPAQQQYGPPQVQAQQYGPPAPQAQQYGPPPTQQYGPPMHMPPQGQNRPEKFQQKSRGKSYSLSISFGNRLKPRKKQIPPQFKNMGNGPPPPPPAPYQNYGPPIQQQQQPMFVSLPIPVSHQAPSGPTNLPQTNYGAPQQQPQPQPLTNYGVTPSQQPQDSGYNYNPQPQPNYQSQPEPQYNVPELPSTSDPYPPLTQNEIIDEAPQKDLSFVYVYGPPPGDEATTPRPVPIKVPYKKDTHYQIVFIKSPSPPRQPQMELILPPANEQKTLVYVLVKKNPNNPNIKFVQPPTTSPKPPQVFFIKYQNGQNKNKGLPSTSDAENYISEPENQSQNQGYDYPTEQIAEKIRGSQFQADDAVGMGGYDDIQPRHPHGKYMLPSTSSALAMAMADSDGDMPWRRSGNHYSKPGSQPWKS